MSTTIEMQVVTWLLRGDVGLSSKAMAGAVLGVDAGRRNPSDPNDFQRCIRFLAAVPLAYKKMHLVADLSPAWAALVENWGELEILYAQEMHQKSAPMLYKRMKELGC
jgi:hypothetical protein